MGGEDKIKVEQVMGEVQQSEIEQYLETQDVQADFVIGALRW